MRAPKSFGACTAATCRDFSCRNARYVSAGKALEHLRIVGRHEGRRQRAGHDGEHRATDRDSPCHSPPVALREHREPFRKIAQSAIPGRRTREDPVAGPGNAIRSFTRHLRPYVVTLRLDAVSEAASKSVASSYQGRRAIPAPIACKGDAIVRCEDRGASGLQLAGRVMSPGPPGVRGSAATTVQGDRHEETFT